MAQFEQLEAHFSFDWTLKLVSYVVVVPSHKYIHRYINISLSSVLYERWIFKWVLAMAMTVYPQSSPVRSVHPACSWAHCQQHNFPPSSWRARGSSASPNIRVYSEIQSTGGDGAISGLGCSGLCQQSCASLGIRLAGIYRIWNVTGNETHRHKIKSVK